MGSINEWLHVLEINPLPLLRTGLTVPSHRGKLAGLVWNANQFNSLISCFPSVQLVSARANADNRKSFFL